MLLRPLMMLPFSDLR